MKARLGRLLRRLRKLSIVALVLFLLFHVSYAVLDQLYPFEVAAWAQYGESPQVVARDGTPMRVGLTAQTERLIPVALTAVSLHLQHAVIAAEDRRFHDHSGVDVRAAFRAAKVMMFGGARQGASTITMQLARLLDPQPRTVVGKAVQSFRALQLEDDHTKAELLELYLNLVPFGGNLRGIGAAAHAWFGKHPRDLTAAESALLASVLPAPGRWAPQVDPEGAKVRRDRILHQMADQGLLAAQGLRQALAAPLGLRPSAFPDFAPHAWQRAGTGQTSIDPEAQRALESLVANAGGPDGIAIVLIENETAAIRALVGAHDADARQLDATARARAAGSTFKPFLYALAFDLGLATSDTRLLDLPWQSGDWAPRNFDEAWRGPVPADIALALSYNLPAIRLAAALPPGALATALRRAGCRSVRSTGDPARVDLALGTDGVTPLELAGAYVALANGGVYRRPWLVAAQGTDAQAGRAPDARSTRVCSVGAAHLVTRALADPARARPGGAPLHGVAWKTGTSSRRRDAWAAGYTRRYTAVVWRGHLDGRSDPRLVGARAATPLLFAALRAVDPRPTAFDTSTGLVDVEVCSVTGLARTAACPSAAVDQRPAGARALTPCTVHHALDVDAKTGHVCCVRCRHMGETLRHNAAIYPPQHAAWRRASGHPVAALPPHRRACPGPLEPASLRPVFTAPRPGQRFEATRGGTEIVIHALAADPEGALRLLIDGGLGGTLTSGAGLALRLRPGTHTLTAIDRRGRSSTVSVEVVTR